MRAYLRLDPNFADRKADYPDGAHRAYIDCLCFAEQQAYRGRFRNAKLLRVLLEKRARWLPFLVAKGDLLIQNDGQIYVEGWDEWQEGDVTVPERMVRLRARKARNVTGAVTGAVTGSTVTVPSERLAVGGKRLAVGGAPLPNGGAPTFMGYRPKASASDIKAQHDASFQMCAQCGQRKGGPFHGSGRDHEFVTA